MCWSSISTSKKRWLAHGCLLDHYVTLCQRQRLVALESVAASHVVRNSLFPFLEARRQVLHVQLTLASQATIEISWTEFELVTVRFWVPQQQSKHLLACKQLKPFSPNFQQFDVILDLHFGLTPRSLQKGCFQPQFFAIQIWHIIPASGHDDPVNTSGENYPYVINK